MEKLNHVLERARLMHKHLRPIMVDIGEIESIAEAFRALEQEKDKAEVEKAGAEERIRMMFDAKNHWADRARAAEAKLAELDKQEPVAYVHPAYLQAGALGFDASVGRLAPAQIPLFTRPAPAINLAEMVPDEDEVERIYSIYCTPTLGSKNALRHIRKEILRNIEEAK